jgi:hypothetical protein
MCQTESPTEILLRWDRNYVQEDSFQLNLRRKTKWVNTNFFLNSDNAGYYRVNCPVDNNYAMKTTFCSGSYVNGAFNFYPMFKY